MFYFSFQLWCVSSYGFLCFFPTFMRAMYFWGVSFVSFLLCICLLLICLFSLEWTAPAYLKKEGASSHPVTCKYSLQYGGRPNWRFVERVGT